MTRATRRKDPDTVPRRSPKAFGAVGLLVLLFAGGFAVATVPLHAGASVTSTTFDVQADAYVSDRKIEDAHGSADVMRIEARSGRAGYLRFNVDHLEGEVASAKLRIYAVKGGSGVNVHSISGEWDEATVSYATAPQPGAAITTSPAFGAHEWVEVDITALVATTGPLNLALTSAGDDLRFATKEGDPNLAAELVVITQSAGVSSSSSTTATSTASTSTATSPTTTTTPTSTATTIATTTNPTTTTSTPSSTTSTTTTTSATTAHPQSPPPSTSGPDPLTCAGYVPARTYLESQAWWMRTPGRDGMEFGHVHVGTCFPWGKSLAGVVHFDMRVVMHMNPGVLSRLRVQIFRSGAPDPVVSIPLGYRCEVETCAWSIPVDIDTRVAQDGCQEFRFAAFVREPDGKELRVTNGWRADLANGNPTAPYCTPLSGVNYTEGRGWYTDFGYQNARIQSPLPTSAVSGIWSPRIRAAIGADGIPTTYHMVTVDPNFHDGDHGTVLIEGVGPWGTSPLAIDTRRFSNGRHRLVIKTDAATPTRSTLSGLLVVPFTVAN